MNFNYFSITMRILILLCFVINTYAIKEYILSLVNRDVMKEHYFNKPSYCCNDIIKCKRIEKLKIIFESVIDKPHIMEDNHGLSYYVTLYSSHGIGMDVMGFEWLMKHHLSQSCRNTKMCSIDNLGIIVIYTELNYLLYG